MISIKTGFCDRCQHPTAEDEKEVNVIVDDENGVRPTICPRCTAIKRNGKQGNEIGSTKTF